MYSLDALAVDNKPTRMVAVLKGGFELHEFIEQPDEQESNSNDGVLVNN